jgi:hypothetical protein
MAFSTATTSTTSTTTIRGLSFGGCQSSVNPGTADTIPISASQSSPLGCTFQLSSFDHHGDGLSRGRATIASPVNLHDSVRVQRRVPVLCTTRCCGHCHSNFSSTCDSIRISQPEYGSCRAVQQWSPAFNCSQQCAPLDGLGDPLPLCLCAFHFVPELWWRR